MSSLEECPEHQHQVRCQTEVQHRCPERVPPDSNEPLAAGLDRADRYHAERVVQQVRADVDEQHQAAEKPQALENQALASRWQLMVRGADRGDDVSYAAEMRLTCQDRRGCLAGTFRLIGLKDTARIASV